MFLKECLRSVEVSESLFKSVEPEQSSECEVKVRSSKIKRGETAVKKHAHKAHCLHFRGQHSQIKKLSSVSN